MLTFKKIYTCGPNAVSFCIRLFYWFRVFLSSKTVCILLAAELHFLFWLLNQPRETSGRPGLASSHNPQGSAPGGDISLARPLKIEPDACNPPYISSRFLVHLSGTCMPHKIKSARNLKPNCVEFKSSQIPNSLHLHFILIHSLYLMKFTYPKVERLKAFLPLSQGICGYSHSLHPYGDQKVTPSSIIHQSFDFSNVLIEEGEEEGLAEGVLYRAEPALVSQLAV